MIDGLPRHIGHEDVQLALAISLVHIQDLTTWLVISPSVSMEVLIGQARSILPCLLFIEDVSVLHIAGAIPTLRLLLGDERILQYTILDINLAGFMIMHHGQV